MGKFFANMKTYCLVFFALLVGTSDARKQSYENSTSYVAGVVEYFPNRDLSIVDRMETNLKNYISFISIAKARAVDILVFPESTFNRYDEGTIDVYKGVAFKVPHGDKGVVPCDQPIKYNKMLKDISCSAKDHKIYVVINVVESVECNRTMDESCPDHEFYLFNTNVVFDRKGTIISRYRKINLFGEAGFTPSIDKELGVFDTDFGVRFGHFICFDLMFQSPAVEILKKEKVRDIIFPTMWFSELPFLTAVQIQESFAWTHNVNLLAAGANNPKIGSTGSGIYSGRSGQLISVMKGNSSRLLLVDEVPKIPGTSSKKAKPIITNMLTKNKLDDAAMMDSLFLKREKINIYKSHLLDMNETQVVTLTYDDVTCVFKININTSFVSQNEHGSNSYKYRAMVFDGVRSYSFKTGGNINCAIVACTDFTMTSCASRFAEYSSVKQSFEITTIEITATVPKPVYNETLFADNIVYHPVTLDTRIMPLKLNFFDYSITEVFNSTTRIIVKMTLKEPQSEILTFGIMGRSFEKDNWPESAANTAYTGIFKTLSMLFLTLSGLRKFN